MERVHGWIYRRFGERAERDGTVWVMRRNRNRTACASIQKKLIGKANRFPGIDWAYLKEFAVDQKTGAR
jgi:hypothetical protein